MNPTVNTPEQPGGSAAGQRENRQERIRGAFAELHNMIVEVSALQKCIVATVAGLHFAESLSPESDAVGNGIYGIDRFLDGLVQRANTIDGLFNLRFPDEECDSAADPFTGAAPGGLE